MAYMIDTSVAIPMRDGDASLIERIVALPAPPIMSVLTRVELEGGVWRVPSDAAARRYALDTMLATIPVFPFDDDAAVVYGHIIGALGWSRAKIFDRMIAAHAIRLDVSLVTLNGADFRGIPGLKLQEWA